MTTPQLLPWLVAAIAATAAFPTLGGDAVAAAASAPPPVRSAEATKARQEADRQRLVAKLRADAPKANEKPTASVLDLPIFHRNDRP